MRKKFYMRIIDIFKEDNHLDIIKLENGYVINGDYYYKDIDSLVKDLRGRLIKYFK